jgi:hypothetical protein
MAIENMIIEENINTPKLTGIDLKIRFIPPTILPYSTTRITTK